MTMKKSLIYLLLSILGICSSVAQSVSQDAEGFSTIVLPATNFNFDIANNEANFNVNTYIRKDGKSLRATQAGWLIGGEITGRAENGIGQIFSQEEVATSAQINFLLGRKWFRYKGYKKQSNYDEVKRQKNEFDVAIDRQREAYKKFISELLFTEKIDEPLYEVVKTYLLITTEKKLNEKNKYLDSIKDGIENKKIKDRIIDPKSIEAIQAKYSKEFKEDLKESKVSTKKLNDISSTMIKYYFQKVFIRSGVSGSEFKYDLGEDFTTVESRFEKRKFEGWNAELGYNLQYLDDHFFGLSYQIRRSNNLSDLNELEFTLTTKDTTITDGQFTSSTTVKAFSGKYDTFNRHSLNFDYVWVTPIKDDDQKSTNIFLALNPYLRHRIYSGSKELKNNTVIGIALNAFNSQKQKVMAGISVQANDVFGVHANDDSTLGKRFSVGLLAKYTFSGIKVSEK